MKTTRMMEFLFVNIATPFVLYTLRDAAPSFLLYLFENLHFVEKRRWDHASAMFKFLSSRYVLLLLCIWHVVHPWEWSTAGLHF